MKTTYLDQRLVADDATAQSGFARAISGFVDGLRKAAANRALSRQLSEMDDTLLRDIGLGDDEIYRLRAGSTVSRRDWR